LIFRPQISTIPRVNNYLLTVVIRNDLDEKARGELLADIEKRFGKLNKNDLWGVRDLAYPIKHQTKAFYSHYEFESEPDTISSLDKSLKLNEDIIRYLLIRYNPNKKMKKVTTRRPETKQEDKKEEETKAE
jgi:small subunit ribosomal protein S6